MGHAPFLQSTHQILGAEAQEDDENDRRKDILSHLRFLIIGGEQASGGGADSWKARGALLGFGPRKKRPRAQTLARGRVGFKLG